MADLFVSFFCKLQHQENIFFSASVNLCPCKKKGPFRTQRQKSEGPFSAGSKALAALLIELVCVCLEVMGPLPLIPNLAVCRWPAVGRLLAWHHQASGKKHNHPPLPPLGTAWTRTKRKQTKKKWKTQTTACFCSKKIICRVTSQQYFMLFSPWLEILMKLHSGPRPLQPATRCKDAQSSMFTENTSVSLETSSEETWRGACSVTQRRAARSHAASR